MPCPRVDSGLSKNVPLYSVFVTTYFVFRSNFSSLNFIFRIILNFLPFTTTLQSRGKNLKAFTSWVTLYNRLYANPILNYWSRQKWSALLIFLLHFCVTALHDWYRFIILRGFVLFIPKLWMLYEFVIDLFTYNSTNSMFHFLASNCSLNLVSLDSFKK